MHSVSIITFAFASLALSWLAWRIVLNWRGGVRERNPGPPGSYHFIGWSIRQMPDWFNRAGMRLGTTLCLWTLHHRRAASQEYLRLVLGREPVWNELWEHFFGFTKYLLLRMGISQGDEPEVRFAPGQGDELRALITQGRPALFGTMHIGRSELAGFFLCRLGGRIHMIRKRVGNSVDTDRLARQYQGNVSFIWINDWKRLVLAMSDALRAGHSLAMQCDRPEHTSKREGFDFLGARRVFPFTIYHLAIMHDMPVVLSYAVPDPDNSQKTIIHAPPIFWPREEAGRQENFAAARAHFQAFLNEIEALLRRDPYLWLNFTRMNPLCSAESEMAAAASARRLGLRNFSAVRAGDANDPVSAASSPVTPSQQSGSALT